MEIVEADLGEQLDAADGEGILQPSRDQKGNDQSVDTASHSPGNGFDKTTIMFVGHAATR